MLILSDFMLQKMCDIQEGQFILFIYLFIYLFISLLHFNGQW